MENFRFLNWPVYSEAKILFKKILEATDSLPSHRKYQLADQLVRSAQSVVLNIAEGSGKHSDPDLNRFFNIALGSLNETLAGLDLLKENDLITGETFSECLICIESINKQLLGFKKKIRADLA